MPRPGWHSPAGAHGVTRVLPRTVSLLAVALVGVLALTGCSAAQPVAGPSPTDGGYQVQNLGADRMSENFTYRTPSLAYVGHGVVLAMMDALPGHSGDVPDPDSIVERRSVDDGRTWGAPRIVLAGHAGAAKMGYSDPSLVVDNRTGRVFLFTTWSKDAGFAGSAYGDDDADRSVLSAVVLQSDDAGRTWSAPRSITAAVKPANGTTVDGKYRPAPGDVRGAFATSGGGIQLRYGPHADRVLQPFAGLVRQRDGATVVQAYAVYSDDDGRTWTRGAFVGTGMDENKLAELSDGRVMLNSRDSANGHLRKVAVSDDGGMTFGAVTTDAQLPDPTSNASLIRLHPDAPEASAAARILLFTNSDNGADSRRVNGAVRVSCDDGRTWPGLRILSRGFFAYSSSTILGDGRIAVLWEGNYTDRMELSTFDAGWLGAVCTRAPTPAPAQR